MRPWRAEEREKIIRGRGRMRGYSCHSLWPLLHPPRSLCRVRKLVCSCVCFPLSFLLEFFLYERMSDALRCCCAACVLRALRCVALCCVALRDD